MSSLEASGAGLQAEDAKGLELLADLDDEERAAVAGELESWAAGPGTRIFSEGDEADGLYLVVRGSVRIASSHTGEGCDLGAGAAFGGLALVASGPRPVQAETTSRATLALLRREAYERLRADQPQVACRLLEAVVREVARLGRAALADAEREPAADVTDHANGGGVDRVHCDE